MGLASALSTALTGLTAAETQIDVVGNNLANSQTVGFKESQVSFTTQFLQTLSLGSAPTGVTGGTNPRQIGFGTQVSGIAPQFTQGTIQTSSLASDVALQGDGFFIVQATTGETLYTRSGMFTNNAANELVTVSGERVMGFGVDEDFQLQTTELVPITIPLGTIRVAQETQNVYLEGTLPSTGDMADTAEVVESAVLGDASLPRADATGATSSAASVPNEAAVNVVQTDAGGSHPENVTYRYRFAFEDPTGTESTVSDELSVLVPTGNGAVDNTITLQDLPTAPTQYDTLNVYRTAADGNDYYLLDSVNVAGGGAVQYVDDGSQAIDLSSPLNQSVLNGNYSYLVSYTAPGFPESRPSELIGPINVADGRIQLRDIPAPPVPGPGDSFPAYTGIRIYRNLANDSDAFYLVDEVLPGEIYTDGKADSEIVLGAQLDLDGPKISGSTLLTDVVKRDILDFEQLFEVGTLDFGGRKGGRLVGDKSFEVTATSTVQDLLDFIQDTMGIQQTGDDPTNPIPDSENGMPGETSPLPPGITISPEGRIRIVSNNGEDNAIDIDVSSMLMTDSTTGDSVSPNLGFGSVQEAVGQSAVADFLAYDSLGVPVNVRVTAVMEDRDGQATTYRWFADSPDNDPLRQDSSAVGTGLIRFDGEGNFLSATNSTVNIDRRNTPAATPLSFDLDFSSISGLAADDATLAVSQQRQDGSPPGTLASYSIGEDGTIRGAFSNGATRTLGQLRLARFTNPIGLEQRGENLFSVGPNSGLPVEGNPGENGIATIIAGAVELSNTDVGGNLIDLVMASTQYRANTRVISTSQQLLDELLNIRR